jgi:hypothetical protein
MNLTSKYNKSSEKELAGVYTTIADESGFQPSNIISGTSIHGITGTFVDGITMDTVANNHIADVWDGRTVTITPAQFMASRIPTIHPDDDLRETGSVYFDTETNRLMVYNGTQWIAFSGVLV